MRAKLGLAPLDVGGSGGGGGGESGIKTIEEQEVFVKTESISKKKEDERIRERLELQRQKRKISNKLASVKKLADDSDDDENDTAAWIAKSRELEKKRAAEKEKMLATMDEEIEEENQKSAMIRRQHMYKERDLRGLKVGHAETSFQEGSQVILTLQDKAVLDDEEEDTLINVNLIDTEKAAENVENKKKGKNLYNPYDDGDEVEGKNLLSKYDQEIDGKKKEMFKLGGVQSVRDKLQARLKEQQEENVRKGINLDSGPLRVVASEYYTEAEMQTFKKPKKKIKKKILRKRGTIEDEIKPIPDMAEVVDSGSRRRRRGDIDDDDTPAPTPPPEDPKQIISKRNLKKLADIKMDLDDEPEEEEDFSGIVLDDEEDAKDELQASLAKARRLNAKDKAASATEKLANTVAMERDEDDDAAGINIVLNSTAEFCRTLGDIPTYGSAGNREQEFEDDVMDETPIKEEAAADKQPSTSRTDKWNEVDPDAEHDASMDSVEQKPILEEEPEMNMGVAGALMLAMKKGYIEKDTKSGASASGRSNMEAKNYTIEEKFYDEDRGHRRGGGDRYAGPTSSFQEKSGYKPNVQLEYIDDNGRLMNQKEAFRVLSHKFHGKGPGKNKIDKRQKKHEQESALRQMSSIDTPLNTVQKLQEKQKELHSPYVVLSGQQ